VEGGFARFITMFVLGLPTIGEFHHLVETMRVGHYTPGTVTAVPSVVCGVLFLKALVNEYRPLRAVRVRASLLGGVSVECVGVVLGSCVCSLYQQLPDFPGRTCACPPIRTLL
jgi:hypothetical protein